jgi:hypothetical protein
MLFATQEEVLANGREKLKKKKERKEKLHDSADSAS